MSLLSVVSFPKIFSKQLPKQKNQRKERNTTIIAEKFGSKRTYGHSIQNASIPIISRKVTHKSIELFAAKKRLTKPQAG
jgi:hypothetical protein